MMTMSNQAQASATTAVPAITVKDIVVSFEQKDVLKGITWEVPTGAITTLIGPNGCGKSTLLKCITGSVKPISGTIYINGQKASSYSPRTLAQRMAFCRSRRKYRAIWWWKSLSIVGAFLIKIGGAIRPVKTVKPLRVL